MDYIKQMQCLGLVWFFKHVENKVDCKLKMDAQNTLFLHDYSLC